MHDRRVFVILRFVDQNCHCGALGVATSRFSLFLPLVPVMTGNEAVEIWRGLRPCSPDGLPYIGRLSHYDNLIISAGHGKIGISLAPNLHPINRRIWTLKR